MQDESKNKPTKVFRCGAVEAAIWVDHRVIDGAVVKLHSIRITKNYRQDDEWKSTATFTAEDLPKVSVVALEAYRFLRLRSEEPSGTLSIGALSDTALTVTLIAVFAIVFVVARGALKELPLCGQKNGWFVAVCVAALSVMGLLRFFGSPGRAPVASEPRNGDGVLDTILLPYVCLALSTIFILLQLALSKWLPGRNVIPHNRQQKEPVSRDNKLTKQQQAILPTSLQKRSEK